MNSFRAALSFLTILPVGPRSASQPLGPARAYFPLVGLVLGAALGGIDLGLGKVFPPMLSGAVLVVAMVVLTRALHIEGFMDACDGLLGGYSRERRLDILRDPHIGAFAVVGGMALLLLKWASLVSLTGAVRGPVLLLFPCLSRWGMLVDMELYPYARAQGMGTSFQHGRRAWHVALGSATAIIASLLFAGIAGAVLLAVAFALAWGLGRWMAGLLGGLTGDAYGAVNEVIEVAVLLAAIAVAAIAPALFRSPITAGG